MLKNKKLPRYSLLLALGLALGGVNDVSAMQRQPSVEIHQNRGIYNCSASCFFNATIQILYHIQPLRDFFVQARANNIYQPNCTTTLLMDFIDQLDASTGPIKSQDDPQRNADGYFESHPSSGFRQDIVNLAKQNRDVLVSGMEKGDQDARDILFHFISKLNEDIQGYDLSWKNEGLSLRAWETLVGNKKQWLELISSIFSTYANPTNYIYTREYNCLTCKKKEAKPVFNDLEIPQIDDPQLYADPGDNGRVKLRQEPATAATLEALLRNVTFKNDPIEGLYCTTCKKNTTQIRTVYFNQLPSVLILQNTYADAQKEYKIDFSYPKQLDLSSYCHDQNLKRRAHYTLIGTIVKSAGHYWTFIHYGNTCYRYDDNSVDVQNCPQESFTNEPWPSAIPGNPYILVYHRNDVQQNYVLTPAPHQAPPPQAHAQTGAADITTTIKALTELGKRLTDLQSNLRQLKARLTELSGKVDELKANTHAAVQTIIDGILAEYIIDKETLTNKIIAAYEKNCKAMSNKNAFLEALKTITAPEWQVDINNIKQTANAALWPN